MVNLQGLLIIFPTIKSELLIFLPTHDDGRKPSHRPDIRHTDPSLANSFKFSAWQSHNISTILSSQIRHLRRVTIFNHELLLASGRKKVKFKSVSTVAMVRHRGRSPSRLILNCIYRKTSYPRCRWSCWTYIRRKNWSSLQT